MELSFLEAALGTTKTATFLRLEDCNSCSGSGVEKGSRLQTCPSCRGSGQESRSRGGFLLFTTCRNCRGAGKINPDPCTVCSGTGLKKAKTQIDVKIPSGINEETILSVPHSGNKQNGHYSDLLIHFKALVFFSGDSPVNFFLDSRQ